jgi:hypothetical protein
METNNEGPFARLNVRLLLFGDVTTATLPQIQTLL